MRKIGLMRKGRREFVHFVVSLGLFLMRLLSILCGLSFAVMAGFFLACSTVAMSADSPLRAIDLVSLVRVFAPISWAALALALLGGGLAWLSRCEGWPALVTGCGVFLFCHLAVLAGLNGTAAPTLLCLVAAGFAISPLIHMPNSYWRVAG